MTDVLTRKQRSRNMRAIKSKDTSPELLVRSALHTHGLRFRLHVSELPGCPDLVFPKFKVALFVHGCFWHRHTGCKFTTTPKTRFDFWQTKFKKNIARDRLSKRQLIEAGWRVITVWECALKDFPAEAVSELAKMIRSGECTIQELPEQKKACQRN